MKVSYYPGCALEGTGIEYDSSIRHICKALGVELEELEDWSCCGASSAHSTNEPLAIQLSLRNLEIAERMGNQDLLVPCAACYNRFKVARKKVEDKPEKADGFRLEGGVAIRHVNDFFAEDRMLDRVSKAVEQPLNGLMAVPYYGCLTVRHPKVTGVSNYEDPGDMDRILEVLGAECRPWSYKTDCCGGDVSLVRVDIAKKLCSELYGAADEAGAECIVTDCPLCQVNLDSRQEGTSWSFPVFYITELIDLAIFGRESVPWWKRHLVDPLPLLRSKRFL